MKNVVVVVDAKNIMYCLNKTFKNGKLNYGEYLKRAIHPDNEVLLRGITYITQSVEQSKVFACCLQHMGYDCKFKAPAVRGKKGEENWLKNVNIDVLLALDVAQLIATGKVDKLVIGSTQDSLADLITYARDKAVHTTVFACSIPRTLKEVADECIEITRDLLLEPKEEVVV